MESPGQRPTLVLNQAGTWWTFPHYANFAKQVWRLKDTIPNQQELAAKIETRIGHWSEIVGLNEQLLRRLAAEIQTTELAFG
jgi:hypothetical protein